MADSRQNWIYYKFKLDKIKWNQAGGHMPASDIDIHIVEPRPACWLLVFVGDFYQLA